MNHTDWFQLRDRWIIERADPESTLAIDRTIVGSHALFVAVLHFFRVPEALDIAIFAAVLIGNTDSMLAAKEDLIFSPMQVGSYSIITSEKESPQVHKLS